MEKFSFKDVLVTFAGLFITSFIAWILITATGNNPSEVAKYLYEGGFKGTRNIANSLYQATPLILTAVATLVSGGIWGGVWGNLAESLGVSGEYLEVSGGYPEVSGGIWGYIQHQ